MWTINKSYDDERRGNVHQMHQSMVRYSRWHGFAKAALSVGEDYDFWLNLDRCLLLAYVIQTELRPLDKPDNPFMNEERLQEYKSSIMSLESKSLDQEFDHHFP
jgi:hypothetical protein